MLLAVESLFLQDQGWNAVFNERQPGIMGSRDESEDAHGLSGGSLLPWTDAMVNQRAMSL